MNEGCPVCQGRCCEYGIDDYRGAHRSEAFHTCPYCADGTVPAPVRTPEDERADVLAFLQHAVKYPNPKLPMGHYLEILCESIAKGEHEGWAKIR